MKRFLWLLVLFLLLGGVFAWLIETRSTYVLLNYGNYAIETSLWFFLLVLVLFYFVFHFFQKLLRALLRPGRSFSQWASRRRVLVSKREFYQGIVDYETGAWDKALKKFQAAAANMERPVVAYLYAARAAHKLDRGDIKEEMLHEAAQVEPKASLAVGLVRAELLLAEKNTMEARKVLQGLSAASPKNKRIETLLASLPATN